MTTSPHHSVQERDCIPKIEKKIYFLVNFSDKRVGGCVPPKSANEYPYTLKTHLNLPAAKGIVFHKLISFSVGLYSIKHVYTYHLATENKANKFVYAT